MTLIVAVTSEKSIWMLADRRLSYSARNFKDNARKIFFLETVDGLAILGYTGLGATPRGIEPSDWMARVLRGRNDTMERSLGVLADAVRLRFPQHLNALRVRGAPAHSIIIPAFLKGERRLYSIDVAGRLGSNDFGFRFTRHVTRRVLPNGPGTPRVAVGGAGAFHLLRDALWARNIVRIVAAQDAGRISPQAAAAEFARLNQSVARKEPTVSRECIVAWRFWNGGGAHEFFDGSQKLKNPPNPSIPLIARGTDVNAFVQTVAPYIFSKLNKGASQEIDIASMDAAVAKLLDTPDDSLQ